jgi:hypothetical protein
VQGGARLYAARWLHRASPLRCAGSPLAAVAVVLDVLRIVRRLGLFGFLAHEALRKRSASGSAGNFGIQVGSGRVWPGLAALAGVLTAYSPSPHSVLTA